MPRSSSKIHSGVVLSGEQENFLNVPRKAFFDILSRFCTLLTPTFPRFLSNSSLVTVGLVVISVVTREKKMLKNRGKVGNNKAANLNGMLTMAFKLTIMIESMLDIFEDLIEENLVNGVFPISWKYQKLILSSEIVNPLGEPS